MIKITSARHFDKGVNEDVKLILEEEVLCSSFEQFGEELRECLSNNFLVFEDNRKSPLFHGFMCISGDKVTRYFVSEEKRKKWEGEWTQFFKYEDEKIIRAINIAIPTTLP